MLVAIRIAGQVGLERKVSETLYRMRLRRKYAAVLLAPSEQNKKLLQKVRNFVAYGELDDATLLELVKARGMPKEKASKLSEKDVEKIKKQGLASVGLKEFFRLHPPRKGIDSKKHFGVGKGVLGDNKDKINELVRRML
ncbi:hypothetical protein D6817_04700 [Candidatus Pacearchaeota archaeon]|nr:MAG: hypothetical protein D6817_04700 [Candidatus Pacearchaeota archaeon]